MPLRLIALCLLYGAAQTTVSYIDRSDTVYAAPNASVLLQCHGPNATHSFRWRMRNATNYNRYGIVCSCTSTASCVTSGNHSGTCISGPKYQFSIDSVQRHHAGSYQCLITINDTVYYRTNVTLELREATTAPVTETTLHTTSAQDTLGKPARGTREAIPRTFLDTRTSPRSTSPPITCKCLNILMSAYDVKPLTCSLG